MPITDNMSEETKLPSEVIEQIKYCSPILYRNGMLRGAKITATHYENKKRKNTQPSNLSEIFNQFDKVYSDDGVSIMIDISDLNTVATHYEQENKRLVELLKDAITWTAHVVSELDGEAYWQQYCKENNIKE